MSDSSESLRCPCGFWGSAQTKGLCSKCFKESCGDSTGINLSSKLSSDCVKSALQSLTGHAGSANGSGTSCTPLSSGPTDDVTDTTTSLTISGGAASSRVNIRDTENSSGEASPVKNLETKAKEKENNSSSEDSSTDAASGTKRDFSEMSEEDPDRPKQKNKKRCFKCNCKLELAHRELGRCRCEYVFCLMHRHPEAHDCVFDHKETGRALARGKIVKPTRYMGNSVRRLDSDS